MNEIGRAVALAATIGVSSCSAQTSLPDREDCIVKVDLHWPAGTFDKTREAALTAMIGKMRSWAVLQEPAALLPSLAFPFDNRTEMYMQFPERCDERFDVAQRLLGFSLAGVAGAPSAVVSRNRVEPGHDTIDLRGPYWRN